MGVKFGLHLLTQVGPHEEHSHMFRTLVEEARLADVAGYDSVWVGEHHTSHAAHFPPLMVLSVISQNTRRVKLGTGVLILPLHNPLAVAEEYAFLDMISEGRVIIGVGIGFRKEEFEAFGINLSNRVKRFEEQVKIIQKLLEEHEVSYNGEFYKLRNVTMQIRCIQSPRPPLWIAVGGAAPPIALARAAKLSDAVFIDPIVNIDKARYIAMKTREYRQQFSNRRVEVALFRECMIANDSDTAINEAAKFIIKKYLDYIKWGLPAIKLEFPNPEDIDVEKLSHRFIIGSPTEVIEQLDRYRRDVGVDHFVMRLHHIGMEPRTVIEKVRLFADKVLPYFKDTD